MSDDLRDFFSEISKSKKEKKKKLEEAKKELKSIVGDLGLDSLFKDFSSIKKEQVEKEKQQSKKLEAFEDFFSNIEKPKPKKVVEEPVEEVFKEPIEEVIEEPIVEEQEVEEISEEELEKEIEEVKEDASLIEKSLGMLSVTDNNEDSLTPLDKKFATFEEFQNHYVLLIQRIQQQLSTLGGGGEVNLKYLDDVTWNGSDDNGKFLKYNSTTEKFEFATVSGGGSSGGGISLSDLSVTTNSAGSAALTYNSSSGVFVYTPPDLSSYLTVTGNTSGNAGTATSLATARTIGGVSFDGTSSINLPGVNAAGNQDTSGNAATATALETARNIGGVSFDGTANIILPGVNAAGNQDTTGNADTATTAGTVTTAAQPNITSVGTLSSLHVSGIGSIGTTLDVGTTLTVGTGLSVGTVLDVGTVLTVSGNINANGNIVGDNATNISGIKDVHVGAGLSVVGISTFMGGLFLDDNKEIKIGNSPTDPDLIIYHDGDHSYIKDAGTGQIKILTSTFTVKNVNDNKLAASFIPGGKCNLLFNNSSKLQTTNEGVLISGISSITNRIDVKSDDGTSGRIHFYCESNNAHYLNLQAPPHADFGGNLDVILPSSSGTLLLSDGSGANLTNLPAGQLSGALPSIDGSALTGIVTSIVAGTNITLTGGPTGIVTVGVTTEQVQDIVGAMFSGNTETNITATYQDSDGTIDLVASGGGSGGGEANQNAFSNVAVSGQNTVAADSTTDTLTLVAGSNVTITTDDSTDTVTIAASGGGGGGSTDILEVMLFT